MTDDVTKLVDSWLTYADAAGVLGVPASRVRRLVQEHRLAAVRHPDYGEPALPSAFLRDGDVVKGLSGTLVLLADRAFSDEEAIRWLFTGDESLPGRPIDALREDRGKEVRRRAQALD